MSISGVVLKIDGKNIVIGSFSPGDQKTYTVKVVDGTKIIKREIAIDISKAGNNNVPSYPSKETEIKFEDIRLNDVVFVEANEDIENKTDFEAKSIGIQILEKNVSAGPTETKIPAAPPSPTTPSTSNLPMGPTTTTPSVPSAPKISAPSTPTPPIKIRESFLLRKD
jgi:hypothetical protein